MRCTCFAVVPLLVALTISVGAQQPDFYDINAYRSIYLNFSQANYWTLLQQNYASQTEIPATMIVDGVTYPTVGVRFRGNTSYTQLPSTSEKRSLNIRTDSFVPGQDLYGYDNLNLNNGFHDPTFLREFLCYMVMRQYGPAPGCNFVKVYLNNVYWGVYINVQQPNKDWAREWFESDEGNRYRGFPESGTFANGRCALTWLGATPGLYLSAYQVNQGDGVDLMQCCDILNNSPIANIQTALPVIFSVDQFYRYASVMNVMVQTDSYLQSGKDHYLYHDPVHGQFHMFPFDLNEALGTSTNIDVMYQTTNTFRPCFTRTIPQLPWRQRYIAHYRTIAEEVMNWAYLGPIITQFHAMIANDVVADTKKIYTTQQFFDNVTLAVTPSIGGGPGGGGTIPGLQPLIQNRDNFLSAHAELTPPRPTLSNLAHSPANPTPGQAVTFTVQATTNAATVQLWRRTLGPFVSTPMFDDGLHGDGAASDGVWGVILPAFSPGAKLDYYVLAATATGVTTVLPKTAEHKPRRFQVAWPQGTSPVRINELLAINNSVIQDPAGEWEDYIELCNTDSNPVALGGYYLTDDLTNSTKWQIPVGTTIAPNSTLIVWCDEDGTQTGLHANFKLSSGGETVALFAADGMTQLDGFTFGAQSPDISLGRLFDGGLPFVSFPNPTPNVLNELPGCGTRRYSSQSPASHNLNLSVVGTPTVGASAVFSSTGGPVSSFGLFVVSPLPAHGSIPGTSLTLLVDLAGALIVPFNYDLSGNYTETFALPNDPMLANLRVFAALAAQDGATVRASNAVEVIICP